MHPLELVFYPVYDLLVLPEHQLPGGEKNEKDE
jgi:hypothetical protein